MENTIGQIIKEKREEMKLSQREFAKITGLSFSYIAKIEKGSRKKPSLETLVKLSQTLDMNLISLVKSSNYTQEEINNILYFYNNSDISTEELSKSINVENEILKKCLSYDGTEPFYDIYKVLKLYKKGKLTDTQTIKLISLCKEIVFNDMIAYQTENGIITI